MKHVAHLQRLRRWQELGPDGLDALAAQVEAMKAEGCQAVGVLEDIFNGVTANGEPIDPTLAKVATIAASALIDPQPCDHKARNRALEAALGRIPCAECKRPVGRPMELPSGEIWAAYRCPDCAARALLAEAPERDGKEISHEQT